MNNKTYDNIVFVSRILISALGALYIAIAEIWKLPYGAEVGLTVSALTAFINSIMEIKSHAYFSDKEIIEKDEDCF